MARPHEDETQSHVNDLFENLSHKSPCVCIDLRKWLVLNDSMTSELAVELGAKSYPIHFPNDATSAIQARLGEYAAAGRVSVLLTDDGVARAQSEFLAKAFGAIPRLIVPAGERTKSLENLGRVLDFLAAKRINRQGILWVVGGGVVGDLGGFSAASYLRGIQYVQVPTTLLAMVDSSVGGKTGINLSAGKNLVGAFHHPREVFIHAIRDNSAAVICVHNHPSGSLSPSPEDLEITRRLREAGEILGIAMLDHLIISKNGFFSMVEHGLLSPIVGE